jgi:hypothetical protein
MNSAVLACDYPLGEIVHTFLHSYHVFFRYVDSLEYEYPIIAENGSTTGRAAYFGLAGVEV